jgi:3-oxoacyl-[acyl-carrier protein] reductase
MSSDSKKRVVVVTGAGSGIGRAIVQAFAELGDRVHALDLIGESAKQTADQLSEYHVVPHAGDVSVYDDIAGVMGAAAADGGRVDVVVAAAGVYDGYAGIEDATADLWNRIIGVNLTGTFNTHRAAVPFMKSFGGRLIAIGSIGGTRGAPDGIAYAASKSGLDGMNRRLSLDVAEYGITANVIAPGLIDTPIRETSLQHVGHLYPAEKRRTIPQDVLEWLVPLRRAGQPSEIAATAAFLASEGAAYITGQTLYVDGGWTAQ